MGRPSLFTQEIADEICRAVSTSIDGLGRLCKRHEHWPEQACINGWRLDYPNFGSQYARAKQLQADLMAEHIVDVSINRSNDELLDANGAAKPNMASIQRDRLIVDSYKWIASKLMPKVYGDKQQVDTNVTITHEDTLKGLE